MKFFSILGSFFLVLSASAASLKDYKPYKFEVLFTNPECEEYKYPTPVRANNGTLLTAKPKNVYCKAQDHAASAKRKTSPHFRLLEWINHSETKEIFMAYLSFSNSEITDALCSALKRGVSLQLVLDAEPGETNAHAEKLRSCGKADVFYRGNRAGLGFSHNKLTVINPHHNNEMKLVFSSANMSTGTSIHHENWNFVTTSQKSYFAQAHDCLMDGMIQHGEAKKTFVAYIDNCRKQITVPEEDDIKTFFVPGEGKKAFAAIKSLAFKSQQLNTVAHRFSGIFLDLFQELLAQKQSVRLVTDDDMYWSYKYRRPTGRNSTQEAIELFPLVALGLELRFLETNHNAMLLQHNKFMVFELNGANAVFTGAGNFTTSAFENNYENYYLISLPEVVQSYQEQFENFWNEMSTQEELMPEKDVRP
jgi:phosphatidylserine/phosphatidylglycerophosphate/cardiolipin synthase-like enzyme